MWQKASRRGSAWWFAGEKGAPGRDTRPRGCTALGESQQEQKPRCPAWLCQLCAWHPLCIRAGVVGRFGLFPLLNCAQPLLLHFITGLIDLGSSLKPGQQQRASLSCRPTHTALGEPRHLRQVPGVVPSLCQVPGSLRLHRTAWAALQVASHAGDPAVPAALPSGAGGC